MLSLQLGEGESGGEEEPALPIKNRFCTSEWLQACCGIQVRSRTVKFMGTRTAKNWKERLSSSANQN